MKKFSLIIVVLCVMLIVAGTALAGEATEQAARKSSLLTLLWEAGLIGFLILILSFVGTALIIEHAMTIRRDKLLPHFFIAELEELFENEEYEEALQLCETEDNLLSRIVAAGLSKVDMGYDVMEESMAEAAEESSLSLQHKISYVSLIGAISPMLGLLGTVVGMIISFEKIANLQGQATPAELASGISMALVTTVLGLIVAIPMMAAYHYFRNKVMRFDLESGIIAGDLMRRFRPAQKQAS